MTSVLVSDTEYFHNKIQKNSSKIAKLVTLQRSLKKDLCEQITTARVLRSMDRYNLMRFKNLGEL